MSQNRTPDWVSFAPVNLKLLAATALIAAPASVWAATVPYSNDFSGSGTNTAFTTQDTTYSVTGGVYKFSTSNTATAASNASIQLTDLGTQSFTIQSQVTVTSFGAPNGQGITVGLGSFGGDSTFSAASAAKAYYLADWTVDAGAGGTGSGTLRILSLGDASGFNNVNGLADGNTSSTSFAATLNTTYTLKLTGTYTGSGASKTLNLSLGVFDATGTTKVAGSTFATATDTSPLTGTNFGYRNRLGIGGGTFTTNFDNYSVAVPEPASLSILAGAGLLSLRRRRR